MKNFFAKIAPGSILNRRRLVFVVTLAFVLLMQTHAQVPTIISFAPASGPVGTLVVITGTNFSPVAADNIVFFGAVRATVNTATGSSITVSAPAGATFAPIAVTTNGLSAYSNNPFIIKFGNNNGSEFLPGSFVGQNFVLGYGSALASDVVIYDLDGDGKLDLVKSVNGVISVSRNIGSPGSIAFAAQMIIPNVVANNIAIADLDGDGKPDLMAGGIFRNISTPGSIAFAPKQDIAVGRLTVGDFDGDGRPDLALAHGECLRGIPCTISVLKNISSPGSIAFAAEIVIASSDSIDILTSDLDGDGKPDLVVSGGSIYRNTSSGGNISFVRTVSGEITEFSFAAGDLDGDGKPDLVSDHAGVTIYRNTSSIGSISFATTNFPAGARTVGTAIADFDGDGKPDIALADLSPIRPPFFLLRNKSSVGAISFSPAVSYVSLGYASRVVAGDLDGDGRPDLVLRIGDTSSSIYRNHLPAVPCTTPPVLYGSTFSGGSGLRGVIFSFNPVCMAYTKIKDDFNGFDGANPSNSLVQAASGKLYGMSNGGANSFGNIFSLDPITHTYTNLKDFTSLGGAYPQGNLIRASDGKLYGTTTQGGSNGVGVLFSFDPVSNNYNVIRNFSFGADGAFPAGSLVQATDGKLYGITTGGGIGAGIIFSYDPVTDAYKKLKDFGGGDGSIPHSSLVQAANGKLYGMTTIGGTGNGVLFSLDPASNTFVKIKNFTGADGADPEAALTRASNGLLYGVTAIGGTNNLGVLFSFDPNTNIYSKLKDFTSVDGKYPSTDLLQASDGKLYGMTGSGGTSEGGVIFSFDPVSNNFSKLKDFTQADGTSPRYGHLTELTPTLCTAPAFLNTPQILLNATCGQSNGNISIIPTSGTGPFMYSIDGGITYIAGTNGGYTFINLSAGTYQLRLKDAGGCESDPITRTVQSNGIVPTFLNTPAIVLNASCGNNDGNISIIPTSGTPPFQYSINGGTTYTNGPNGGFTFTGLAAETYNLQLKQADGCQSGIVSKTVGSNCPLIVAELQGAVKNAVSIIPNPTSGRFRLEVKNFTAPKVEVSIYNGTGTMIQKSHVNLNKNKGAHFDLSGCAPGLYLVKLASPDGLRISRVILQ